MSRKKFGRAFLAASSVLILLTAVGPLAQASDKGKSGQSNNGKSESHGNKDATVANTILKTIQDSPLFNGKEKKFENDGNALEGQTKSLLKKLSKLGAGNPAIASAISTYVSTVDTATATFQISLNAAKASYKSALAAATTDIAKQAAQTAFKAAVLTAQQALNATISAANAALKTALLALLPAPVPSTLPSPSPSSSST